MFLPPVLFGWMIPYVSDLLPNGEAFPISTAIAGDVVFPMSLFVLGCDFWDKLSSLFVRGADVQMPIATVHSAQLAL